MKKITDYAELVKAKHALNKTIAPVEDGASMAGSYTSGKQFIRDSVLYSALTSIAAGTAWSSLTLDTDYEVADDVSTQIAAVNQTLTNKVANEIATRAKVSGHNLLPNLLRNRTNAGITYTRNTDGSVTLDGTSTGYSYTRLFDTDLGDSPVILKKGAYILSGKGGDYATNQVSLVVRIGDTNYTAFGNDEVTITLNADSVMTYASYQLGEGKTLNNLVCYPMLRLATDTNTDYQPYSMTNQEMTPYVQAISNPNLLDNPWFTVNQRGQSSYSTSNTYSFDRWKLFYDVSGASVSKDASENVVIAKGSGGQYAFIRQELEDYLFLNGKVLTMSILLSDDTIFSGTKQFIDSTTPIIFADTNGIRIDFENGFRVINYNASLTIKAVKLELGSVSTLAQDTAPNYATELLKCQRYFIKVDKHLFFTDDIGVVEQPFYNEFRIAPSLTLLSAEYYDSGTSTWLDGTSYITLAAANKQFIRQRIDAISLTHIPFRLSFEASADL